MKKDYRFLILKLFFATFVGVIASRAVWIQLGNDERLERLSRRQFQNKVTALPRRGLILDRNGEGLAISLKAKSLYIRPQLLKKEIPKKERIRIEAAISNVLQIPRQQLDAKLDGTKKFAWIKRPLTDNEILALKEKGVFDFGDSIGLAEEARRSYPNKELGAHIVGSVNIDGQGIEGLEFQYDKILNGTQTRIASGKDAMGRRVFQDDDGILAIQDGQSILLTIDKSVQYEAEKSLKKAISEYNAKSGTVIVADVRNGEILALANYPTFNPNNAKTSLLDHRRNRAISDTFEPGSTFKPLLVAHALERGKSPQSRIYCEKGLFKVGGRKISEAESDEKFGWLTLGELVKLSSNIGAAKLALELGPGNVSQLFEKLSFGQKTGIDLPGEATGVANKDGLKNQVRLANVGFGHGFTVTPIQMLSYYLSIANGGTWVQPKLVKAVIEENPETLEKGGLRYKLGLKTENAKSKSVFSRATTQSVTRMLEMVTEDKGTGTKAQLEEWPVAGKTGTAQKVDPQSKRYSKSKYIASFVGFAPSKNPSLVAIVVIDEPKKHYYASETAAPAFKDVMKASLMRQGIVPLNNKTQIRELANKTMIESFEKPDQVSAIKKDPVIPDTANDGTMIRLPSLEGLTVREAIRVLSNEPLDVEITGSGILHEQTPKAYEWVKSGSKVKLHFSR